MSLPYCLDVPKPSTPLSPLQLFYVLYPTDQPSSKLLALASMLPLLLFSSQLTLMFAQWHQRIWLKLVLGQLFNEFINQGLKKLIKEPRPTEYLGTGFGMPSNHSQFMAFFGTTLLLIISSYPIVSRFSKTMLHTIILSLTLLVAYSRVVLNYHTEFQVMMGLFIGTIIALVWHVYVPIDFVKKSSNYFYTLIREGPIRE